MICFKNELESGDDIEAKIRYKLIRSTLFEHVGYAYGIDIVNELDEIVYSPNYPFVFDVKNTVALEEFLEDYTSVIIDYCEGDVRKYHGISEYLYGLNTESKYFKDRWFLRGVVVD